MRIKEYGKLYGWGRPSHCECLLRYHSNVFYSFTQTFAEIRASASIFTVTKTNICILYLQRSVKVSYANVIVFEWNSDGWLNAHCCNMKIVLEFARIKSIYSFCRYAQLFESEIRTNTKTVWFSNSNCSSSVCEHLLCSMSLMLHKHNLKPNNLEAESYRILKINLESERERTS